MKAKKWKTKCHRCEAKLVGEWFEIEDTLSFKRARMCDKCSKSFVKWWERGKK